jgi:hypothetical protein
MHFHWLRDWECQQQFCIYWQPGKANYAETWTKHHPAKHHRKPGETFSLLWLFSKCNALTNNKPCVWPQQLLKLSPSHLFAILQGCNDTIPVVSMEYLRTTTLLPDVFPRTTKTCDQQTYIVIKLDNRFDNDCHVDQSLFCKGKCRMELIDSHIPKKV